MMMTDVKMQADNSTLELSVYDVVESDGWWYESETSAKHFKAILDENPNVKQINIRINSVGGSVMEGIAIYNQLKAHKAHKTVFVDGFACSIASVIAMAGDTVVMPKVSMMMIHNPWTITQGNAKELHKAADDLDKIAEVSKQAYLAKAGDKLTEAELDAMLDAETYIPAARCIELGLADCHELETPADDTAEQLAKMQAEAAEKAKQEAIRAEVQRRNTAVENALKKYSG